VVISAGKVIGVQTQVVGMHTEAVSEEPSVTVKIRKSSVAVVGETPGKIAYAVNAAELITVLHAAEETFKKGVL
jgi:hypothetical protein